MSLIKCPKCGKKNSDATTCVNCGCQFAEIANEENHDSATNLSLIGKIKKWILNHKAISIFVVIVILFCSVGLPIIISSTVSNQLTYEEEVAIENVQNLKDRLKNPDSLKIYDDVIVVFYDNGEDTKRMGYYTYIDYGATNSYGAMIRSTAMYFDSKYIGSLEEAEKIDPMKILAEESRLLTDAEMLLLTTRLTYTAYLLNKPEITSSKIINKEKIMKNLK